MTNRPGSDRTRHPATHRRLEVVKPMTNTHDGETRTPEQIAGLQEEMPAVYDELYGIGQKLEQHFREMQDIEFTIEHARLYMLQTRSAKRTANSAVKVAVDMVDEKLIPSASSAS